MMHHIDHIVYAVPDMDGAIEWFKKEHGVNFIAGGKHLSQGTQNALLNLGDQTYLELLAIDYDNNNVISNRWMGIDEIVQPTITRWAMRSNKITIDAKSLRRYNDKMGKLHSAERQQTDGNILRWMMTLPLVRPEVEIAPFLIDWSLSKSHPTDSLPHECELLDIQLAHPHPSEYNSLMNSLGISMRIAKQAIAKIRIKIRAPKGIIEL